MSKTEGKHTPGKHTQGQHSACSFPLIPYQVPKDFWNMRTFLLNFTYRQLLS